MIKRKKKALSKNRQIAILKEEIQTLRNELLVKNEVAQHWKFAVDTIIDQQKAYTNTLVKKIFDLEDENRELKKELNNVYPKKLMT